MRKPAAKKAPAAPKKKRAAKDAKGGTPPSRPIDASLDGNARRAIDLHEGAKIHEKALKTLIRAAAALNASSATLQTRPKGEVASPPKRG